MSGLLVLSSYALSLGAWELFVGVSEEGMVLYHLWGSIKSPGDHCDVSIVQLFRLLL